MGILRNLGWVSALALSGIVAVSSYAIANQVRLPERALDLGVFSTGTASANGALSSFAKRQARDPKAAVLPSERQLAESAYRREPLAVSAVAILALAMTDEAHRETREALFDRAGSLTRRNTLVSGKLIEIAASHGDDKSFFLWLSRVMLTSTGARKVYGAAMADATAKEGAVAALIPILGKKPRWSDFYWSLVADRPASLENGAKLRIAIARPPYKLTDVSFTDRRLIQGLVRTGEFDIAKQVQASLQAGASQSRSAPNRLTNADFARQPALPPFDWELSAKGNLGAVVDTANRRLSISGIGGARGAAARQLLRLDPGNYRLSWSLSGTTPIDPDILSVRIRCADPKSGALGFQPVPVVMGKRHVGVSIAGSDCRWYWFSVDVDAPDDAPGFDVNLEGLSLVPVAGAAG